MIRVPCSIGATEDLDQVVAKITVLVPRDLQFLGRDARPHVDVDGAIVHLEDDPWMGNAGRSEEHTSEIQSLMRISYAVFCLNKKTHQLIRTELVWIIADTRHTHD